MAGKALRKAQTLRPDPNTSGTVAGWVVNTAEDCAEVFLIFTTNFNIHKQ